MLIENEMGILEEKLTLKEQLLTQFELKAAAMSESDSIKAHRKKAIDNFDILALPNKKQEEWKYSNAEALFKEEFALAPVATIAEEELEKLLIPNLDANRSIIINGSYSETLSQINALPAGVIITSFSKAMKAYPTLVEQHFANYADYGVDAFTALNTAFATDGLFIYIPSHTLLEKPLHLINIVTSAKNALVIPRHLIIVEKGAALKIIESFETVRLTAKAISLSVTEVVIGENAKVQYYKLQNEGGSAVHINTTQAQQSLNSHFDTNTITLNGNWLRNNLNIVLAAKNCETHLNGLFLLKDNMHLDNHTLVDHQQPHCESNQLYKGILSGKSTGVFNGKIYVRKDAQKTNAYQSSKNILLSDEATMNTKPQLEIYADDVKCSHGSSTGQISPEALFYLQSRGIGKDMAKKLLMFAFAADAINTIHIAALQDYISKRIEENLLSN